MGMLAVVKNRMDKYKLLESVKVADIKEYLTKEYDRARLKEKQIESLENEIVKYKEIELKYHGMLVVQEETEKRIKEQDEKIKKLKDQVSVLQDNIKLLSMEKGDIKLNAEKKLEQKDIKIKELNKEIKELTKQLTKKDKKKEGK